MGNNKLIINVTSSYVPLSAIEETRVPILKMPAHRLCFDMLKILPEVVLCLEMIT